MREQRHERGRQSESIRDPHADPLSEVTRKERRVLLGISALGIVIVKSGLVPSKVTALRIEFSKNDQQALILALGAFQYNRRPPNASEISWPMIS